MDNLKTIIEKIYSDFNPEKLINVPTILDKYKGKESELLLKLSEKYNINLENYLAIDYLRLVKAILTKYDPVNVSSANIFLAKQHGNEKEALKILREKYNDSFNSIIVSLYSTVNSGNNIHEIVSDKTSDIQKYVPQSSGTSFFGNSRDRIIIICAIAVLIILGSGLYICGVFKSGNKVNITTSPVQPVMDKPEADAKTPVEDNSVIKSTTEENINTAISIVSVTASSFMKSTGRITFFPENVIDNNLQTWWTPSSPHSDGFNSWIKLDFGQNRKVVAIEIHNGSHYPYYPKYGDLYLKNNRLFKAKLEFSNGNTQIINLQEIDAIQKVTFPMQNTTYIKLFPLEWGRGTQWNDLCISELTPIGE